jgi:phenylacetate-coenzyme A ligase PaaK-like adenylate-forming protein
MPGYCKREKCDNENRPLSHLLIEKTPLERWMMKKITGGLKDGESLTAEMIKEYQLDKIRETINLAGSQSPFYRRLLKGISGGDIASLEDLVRLPLTSADDIRENPLQMLCVSQDEISRVVTLQSSGTGGEPKRIYFTREEQEQIVDFFHYGMASLTGPGDRVLILLPGHLPGSVGDLLRIGLERLGAVPVSHGPVADPKETLEVLQQERIDSLVGIPEQVLSLARQRDRPTYLKLKSILLTTDYVPDAIVEILRRTWDCPVFSHYGMTEMGLGGAVECGALAGYHLREADLYFEIIDPVSGMPVPEGHYGEIVFTTLTRRGMPLIRYRTGDVSRFMAGSCPCGTVLKRLEKVRGRLGGGIRLSGDTFITMADLDEAIFPLPGVLNFGAAVEKENEIYLLKIKVKAAGWAGPDIAGRVRLVLESLPALKNAVVRGDLKIKVFLQPVSEVVNKGTVKRIITDSRNSEVI